MYFILIVFTSPIFSFNPLFVPQLTFEEFALPKYISFSPLILIYASRVLFVPNPLSIASCFTATLMSEILSTRTYPFSIVGIPFDAWLSLIVLISVLSGVQMIGPQFAPLNQILK